ncbi:peptide methionine sulfoxide reductase-like protein isoform X2 [Cinnamomum micranthum f. kanehirae]|uniref:peptide-methionine (S)-S-oxide reductase n=1 Tax=Cinnamomum micranthum f. kanehirae TaxID=337451 RepID=A0A443PVL6_9MAGN|nr:peptide methionine sulfoxide reductase-like protein isoform X2 [Cinnamomum micranthum f. kanehirae]
MYELLSQPKNKNSDFCSSDTLPTEITQSDDFLEEAVFAGGGFWGLEAAFGCVDGVVKTAAGYCGGTLKKPTYREVSEGWTGHTEVVKVNYDKRKVSYKLLCKSFWESHDPTNKEYLGFGVDTHYRSAIFYANEEQKKHALQTKIEHQMKLNRRIVTKILPYSTDFFFLAENQHQKYYLQKDYIWVCESLNLRSTQQFIDSSVACKLNGILGRNDKMVVENLKRFVDVCSLPGHTKKVLEEIVEDLEGKS